MRKILRTIFVRRIETKNKWWHRLALVLIYGSTILVAIFLAILILSEEEGDNWVSWVSYPYTAYSFEKEYPAAKGYEIDCKFPSNSFDVPLVAPTVHCGDLSSNTEFLDRYSRARGTYDKLQELRQQMVSNITTEYIPVKHGYIPIGQEYIPRYIPVAQRQTATSVDNELLDRLIKNGELDNIKVKRASSIHYASLLGEWGIYLLLVLAWLLFWESVVYRTVLFVAYGRPK